MHAIITAAARARNERGSVYRYSAVSNCCLFVRDFKVLLPVVSAHLIGRGRQILPQWSLCAARDGTPGVRPRAVTRHSSFELVQTFLVHVLWMHPVVSVPVRLGLLRRRTWQRGSELVSHNVD